MSTEAEKKAITDFRKRFVANGGSILSGVMLSKESTDRLREIQQKNPAVSRTAIIEALILRTK